MSTNIQVFSPKRKSKTTSGHRFFFFPSELCNSRQYYLPNNFTHVSINLLLHKICLLVFWVYTIMDNCCINYWFSLRFFFSVNIKSFNVHVSKLWILYMCLLRLSHSRNFQVSLRLSLNYSLSFRNSIQRVLTEGLMRAWTRACPVASLALHPAAPLPRDSLDVLYGTRCAPPSHRLSLPPS